MMRKISVLVVAVFLGYSLYLQQDQYAGASVTAAESANVFGAGDCTGVKLGTKSVCGGFCPGDKGVKMVDAQVSVTVNPTVKLDANHLFDCGCGMKPLSLVIDCNTGY